VGPVGREELEDVIAENAKSSRSWLIWVAGGAGIGVAVVGILAVLYFTVLTVSLSVDGKSVRLPAGSTVATLYAKSIVDRKPGNLVAAKDRHVLQLGAGDPPTVSANGAKLATDSPLTGSAVLVSASGADIVEPTHTTTEAIAPPTRYEGTGPIETVIQTGTAGVREIKVATSPTRS